MPGLVYQYHWLGPGNGHFLYTSQGLREIVGYEDEPVQTASTGATILGLAGQAHQDFVDTVEEHARAMKPLDLEVEIRRQGEAGYLQIRGHFVHQEGLEGVILNGVVQDITAEREASHIDIDVAGQTVTLRGRVDSWAERSAVQGAAWSAPGITRVDNELRISP